MWLAVGGYLRVLLVGSEIVALDFMVWFEWFICVVDSVVGDGLLGVYEGFGVGFGIPCGWWL